MIQIADRDRLNSWLRRRSREDAVILAVRGALRVLPSIGNQWGADAEFLVEHLLLSAFRMLGVGLFASSFPKISALKIVDVAGEVHKSSTRTSRLPPPPELAYRSSQFAVRSLAYPAARPAAVEAIQAGAQAYGRTERTAADDFWFYISQDAEALIKGPHMILARKPLWIESQGAQRAPDLARAQWSKLRNHLLGLDNGWDVWTQWYELILDGNVPNAEFELAKAVLPTQVWALSPSLVNSHIKLIREEFKGLRNQVPDEEVGSEELSSQIAATDDLSLWDFYFDPHGYAMRPQAFERDHRDVNDPYRMRDEAERLASLASTGRDLHFDLREDRPQVPPSMRRDFKRYANAASVAPEKVNPRELDRLARPIIAALDNEGIREGLGNYLLTKVDGFRLDHNALMVAYFSAVAERASTLLSRDPPASFNAEAAADAVRAATNLLASAEWQAMPTPPSEVVGVLNEAIDETRQRRLALMLKPDVAAREGRRQLYRDTAEIAATAVRLLGQTVKAVDDGVLALGGHPRVTSSVAIYAASDAALKIMRALLQSVGIG